MENFGAKQKFSRSLRLERRTLIHSDVEIRWRWYVVTWWISFQAQFSVESFETIEKSSKKLLNVPTSSALLFTLDYVWLLFRSEPKIGEFAFFVCARWARINIFDTLLLQNFFLFYFLFVFQCNVNIKACKKL